MKGSNTPQGRKFGLEPSGFWQSRLRNRREFSSKWAQLAEGGNNQRRRLSSSQRIHSAERARAFVRFRPQLWIRQSHADGSLSLTPTQTHRTQLAIPFIVNRDIELKGAPLTR